MPFGLLLFSVLPFSPVSAPPLFASPSPEDVGDVSQWEMVAGEFENAHASGSYRFYVGPRHPGLYQLMRYRITFRPPLSEEESHNQSTEKLVWNRHPGERVPLVCWERIEATDGAAAYWRELSPGTSEYVQEMRVLIKVLYLHQSARKQPEQR